MAEFRFITVWHIEAPLVQVCDAISQCLQLPRWWKGVEKVEEIEPGDANGVGRWLLSCDGMTTTVRYEWHVRTHR